MQETEPGHIIVIGASAGGFPIIIELISKLPPDINAAVFIVLHMSTTANAEIILHAIKKQSRLRCKVAENNDVITPGHLYLAPANHHLFIKKGSMLLTSGPSENRFKPSIDVLFRSAAAAYSASVTGIILTGLLDDGASGMLAIKRSGGKCIVQEPTEAEFDTMPISVIKKVDVDYQVSANDIPFILEDILSKPVTKEGTVPEDVLTEAEITGTMTSAISKLPLIGEHSDYTCPDCGGGLWKIMKDPVTRYRCHTGHSYTQKVLLEKQSETLVDSLWVSIRMMEEQRRLLSDAITHNAELAGAEFITRAKERSGELKMHIERLKMIVLTLENK